MDFTRNAARQLKGKRRPFGGKGAKENFGCGGVGSH